MTARILLVDDDASLREFLSILLRQEGYDVVAVSNGQDAVSRVEAEEYDLVITDLKMPRVSGLTVLEKVRAHSPSTQVIVMTAFSTMETAIEAMRKGAYDYISKPFKNEELAVVVEKCLEKRLLLRENVRLKGEVERRYGFRSIVGRSKPILALLDDVARVAPTKTSVLIVGESGTGKELVARSLHYNSPRKDRAFVPVSCGAIPETLMESELFGHVKGSFTGAVANKKGLFEAADGGSVFLDEIGELTPLLQVRLLRVLQERTIKPVGGLQEIPVDVRVIAATNRDLASEVRQGRFREDLYYRLNVILLRLPSLRERPDDIPVLAEHFLKKFCGEMGKALTAIAEDALKLLQSYAFPGNVRELENIIERAVAFESGSELTSRSLPPHLSAGELSPDDAQLPAGRLGPDGVDIEKHLADIEREFLRMALERASGNKTEAARLLGISFRSMRYKLQKYGMGEPDDGSDE